MKAMWIIGTPSRETFSRCVNHRLAATLPCRPFPRGDHARDGRAGFTLLEVMIAVAIIAIACTAILGSQSQSISLASEAKFYTTATLLAQHKVAEIEIQTARDLMSDSGDFGEDFPGYSWELEVQQPAATEPEGVSSHLRQLDLTVFWGDEGRYQYRLRYYAFSPSLE